MRKWAYFKWGDPNMGLYPGPAEIYINDDSKKKAKEKLEKYYGFKHDPDFISGDVMEVEEFTQPNLIKVI